jgi:hypothetical protein
MKLLGGPRRMSASQSHCWIHLESFIDFLANDDFFESDRNAQSLYYRSPSLMTFLMLCAPGFETTQSLWSTVPE